MLIEDADGASQWVAGELLARAGFDVAVCDGPERLPKGRCPLIADGSCALADGADVVLNALPLTDKPNRDLLGALRASLPATPVIVEISRVKARHHERELAGCRLLTTPVHAQGLLHEVESAVRERPEHARREREGSIDPASRPHVVAVCDYVEMPFDVVTDTLDQVDASALLTAVLRTALGPDAPPLSVTSVPLEAIGRGVARITCHVTDQLGAPRTDGTLTVLAVNSGSDSVTEILVSVRVDDLVAAQVAAVARRFVEELTAQMKGRGSSH